MDWTGVELRIVVRGQRKMGRRDRDQVEGVGT